MPGRQNLSKGLVFLSAARGVLRPCPTAKSRPAGFVRLRLVGPWLFPQVTQRPPAAPLRLWAGFRAAPTALAFPVGLERPRRASNSPAAPARSCGTCMQDEPLGFPARLVIGFYPKPVKVVSLFAKGGVCRHRRTASFASLYERDRNMYSYRNRDRDSYRNRYSYSRFCRKPKRQIRHLPLLPPFAGFCRFLPEISGGKTPGRSDHGFPQALHGPAPPPAPAGACKQDGPLGFPAGLVIGFYPKPVKVVSLFAKGGVCRHRRTASFASLYERDRNSYMYSYRDRDSYRNSYSLICYRLLSKSSICLICLRLPGK